MAVVQIARHLCQSLYASYDSHFLSHTHTYTWHMVTQSTQESLERGSAIQCSDGPLFSVCFIGGQSGFVGAQTVHFILTCVLKWDPNNKWMCNKKKIFLNFKVSCVAGEPNNLLSLQAIQLVKIIICIKNGHCTSVHSHSIEVKPK